MTDRNISALEKQKVNRHSLALGVTFPELVKYQHWD